MILIVDGASWHSAEDLNIPSNITFYFLPPYSPELNPIERLWNYLKSNYLARKIFEGLDDIFNIGSQVWNLLTADIIKSVCKSSLKL